MALTVASVETAIEAIMAGGQSVTLDGVTYTAASLPSLMQMRDTLKASEGRTAATRPVFRGFNFGSMGYTDT